MREFQAIFRFEYQILNSNPDYFLIGKEEALGLEVRKKLFFSREMAAG